MSGHESLLVWIVVGLIAGWLASMVMGKGFGLIGDILVGIAGAYIGGHLVHSFGLRIPFAGIPGMITVAFGGAVVLLLVLRALRRIVS